MTDINQYANDMLLEFLDQFHEFLKAKLRVHYGDEWLSQGIERHLGRAYFDKVREMLNSPMKIVDLGRGEEDLYGVEHLSNIVDGNWNILGEVFHDRARTKVYLGEITELRHNLAHRRKRHYLRRDDLLRFVQNARMFLDAINSNQSDKFANVLESIMGGGIPWGVPLAGHLPPQDEIVDEFVERKREHDILGEWLVNDSPQFVLWGYGGAGKSATAYKFAQEVQEAASANLQAVCWVSAKREEFGDGQVRPHGADFYDRESFCTAVWSGLYDAEFPSSTSASEELLRELKETRTLLIVDDIDTVIDDSDLTGFLLYDLRNSGSKILYTSRLELPGLPNEEVKPFNEDQLSKFVQFRCHEYELTEAACFQRLSGIASVTGSYPLFVDDLLRHASISGIDSALEAWSQRKGDAAREYALRRQLEHVGTGTLDTLMSISVASRPLRTVEISSIAGLTDNDVELAIRDLLRWRLVNRVTTEDDISPSFNLNSNTRRLVQKTYSTVARMKGYQTAFRSLSGERVPEAKKAAIGRVIKRAGEILFQGNLEGAAEHIKSAMTGELTDSPDLYGTLVGFIAETPGIMPRTPVLHSCGLTAWGSGKKITISTGLLKITISTGLLWKER